MDEGEDHENGRQREPIDPAREHTGKQPDAERVSGKQQADRPQSDRARHSSRSPSRQMLERDDFSSNRHLALSYSWSMIFSENRIHFSGSCSIAAETRAP